MKKMILVLLFTLACLTLPAITSANSTNLSSGNSSPEFAVVNGNTYYINGLLEGERGIYKMSSNLKSKRLLVTGDYHNLQVYKNTFIVFDYNKGHLVQLSLTGKLMKEFPKITSSSFNVYGNHIYYYNSANRSFYQSQIVGNKIKILRNTGNSYVQEFTIHNGWIYYVHEFYFGDEYSPSHSEEHLSKFQISKPAKAIKIVNKVYNIDTVIIKNGFIYAVIHKTEKLDGRKLYRMNYNGKNLTRVSKENMSNHAINSKYIYYVENSFNEKQKIYRMALNGKNVKAIATLPGRKATFESHGNSLYLAVQKGYNFTLQRHVVK